MLRDIPCHEGEESLSWKHTQSVALSLYEGTFDVQEQSGEGTPPLVEVGHLPREVDLV